MPNMLRYCTFHEVVHYDEAHESKVCVIREITEDAGPLDPDDLDDMGEDCNDCPKYLVCRQCGEAFDHMDPAHDHQKAESCGSWQGWDIQPECVAM